MEPVYKNMHSYPDHKDPMYHGPHCYPGVEAVPTQMHVNPPRPPMGYGCWPWGSNYGYASPVACHGCCNHAHAAPPHYAWGSPYSHVPPHHYPGNYPSFPVQYMPPPPFYGMEQPRYEYEKNVPVEQHCCGCATHPLHQKEQKNLRIEEEELERERRKNDSLVPFQSKNSHYPIVWLPPDYSSNKEEGKVKNTGDWKYGSRDGKANEHGKIAGQQPTLWNGWLPLDLNKLVTPKHREDGGENHQQDDDGRNFPFPLFWIPYKPDEKERDNHKVKDASTKQSFQSEKGSGGEQNFHVNGEKVADQAAARAKDIPVKEVAQHVEKETSLNKEKERDSPVKYSNDNGEKKVDNGEKASSKEGSKRKSPSPPKSSKLPPVCLRVDPLPRKKNGNGSSRSPSPPGNKQSPNSQRNDTNKVPNSLENKEQVKIFNDELKEDKGTKAIKVVDGGVFQGKTIDVKKETPVKPPAKSQDDVSMNQAEEKLKEGHTALKYTENDAVLKGQSEDAGSARVQEMKADEVKKSNKMKLSEEEAAVIIQSAFRGFDVRRWEPIKKLKQIAKVREQIADVKHLIQGMKSYYDIKGRSKQKNIVAETIMSLLLKLDTIQGLHPIVREVRKSVVRELVSLQEQLDSLMNEKPKNSPGQESMAKHDKDVLTESEGAISSQNGNQTTPSDLLEAHPNHIDGGSDKENSEISEADLIGEGASEKIDRETAESCTNKGVELAPEPTIKEDEMSNEMLENDETFAKEDHEVLGQGSEISSLQDDSSAEAKDIAAPDCGMLGSELAELPQGVLDYFCGQEGQNDVEVEADASKVASAKQPEEALTQSRIISEPHDTVDKDSNQTVETREVLDLPLNGGNMELETEETCPIKRSLDTGELDEKLGAEEVDSKSGDAIIEPNESTAQQPQNFIAGIIEPSAVSDEREVPNVEACTRNYTTSNKLEENSGVTYSNSSSESEELLHAPTEKEMPSQLLQEGNFEQETSLINESANTNADEATDMIGVEGATEAESDDNRIDSDNCITRVNAATEINDSGEVSEERQPKITGAHLPEFEVSVDLTQQSEECNTEQHLPKETLEEQGLKDGSVHKNTYNAVDPTLVQDSPARDEATEGNRKLIEENQRLRDMMEKLIKSGQEQLTAISSLSGRVKDLEKKLSRKKKLKVKQYRAPKFDKRNVGVAM